MNKLVIGAVVIVLIGGGFFTLSASQKQEKMEMEAKVMMEKEKMEMEKKSMEEKAMMEKEVMMKVESEMTKDGTTMEAGSMMKNDTEVMVEDDTMMKKEESSMMQKGSYEAYSVSKLALAEKGDVVLFFRATWCPMCKALDGDIKANASSIPAGVTILDVNYDAETALKQKYGVTYQHTLVQVDANGVQLAKWSGSPTLTALISKIQ